MKTVLSIDGGGIRGIIPATILAQIEARTGQPIAKSFDLIAGTSTGAIIATGLSIKGENGQPKYSAQNLVDFYTQSGQEIFHKRCPLRILFSSRYSAHKLEAVLLNKIGDVPFGEMATNVMVPTFDLTDQRPYFFKSWKPVAGALPTHKIVTAACSAPTFFDPHVMRLHEGGEEKLFIDGAVAANNPTMCAYVEAKRLWGDQDIMILSIGAGDVADPIHPMDKKRWGAISWLPTITEVFMSGAVNTIDYQLNTIEPDMYVRMQHKVNKASDAIDDASPKNMLRLREEAEQFCEEQVDNIAAVAAYLKTRSG